MVKMIQIHRLASYVSMLQVIYRQLPGTMAVNVSINQNITGLLGNKDTNLTCSFFPENGEQIISVQIIAKQITEDFAEEKNIIVIFKPGKAAKLHRFGEYLDGRVTLTNITNTSNNATLNFDILKARDEKDYMCKWYYIDMEDAIQNVKSDATRILVKVPVRDVHINKQPNRRHIYDRKTDSITLTCKARGDPEPRYKWFKKDNNNTILSRTNFYVIEDVIRNNSGVYICEAHNVIENVYYTQSNAVNINIVDEMLILLDPASSSSSSEQVSYIAYTVPVILVLVGVFIVSFLTVRKHMSNRPIKEKKKERRLQNMHGCFNRWHGSDENPSYTVVEKNILGDVSKCMKGNEIIFKKKPDRSWHNMLGCFTKRHGSDENPSYAVVDKKEPGDVSNGIQENENICKNKEKSQEENFDISQNLPTSLNNIYAVPCDTLPRETVTCKIIKACGKNEQDGVPYQDAVYSEVFDKANIKSGMSKTRTVVPPDNVDNNGDNDSQDQFQVLNI